MIVRLARIVALAVLVGVGLSQVILALGDWYLSDAAAYWDAAWRLRGSEPLYPPLADPEASNVYRYAPWFAWAWVPLTFLPREIAMVLWSAILLAASAAALWPLVRLRAWWLIALFAPILVGISGIGNAHPLMVAALVHGVERRSGPLWIALAASLKLVPILFVLVYLGRRDWLKAAASLALTALLLAPALLYDLSAYATDPGPAALLYRAIPIYATAVAIGVIATVALATSRFGWLAAATTVTLASPRFFIYDVTYLLVGIARVWRCQPRSDATSRSASSIE